MGYAVLGRHSSLDDMPMSGGITYQALFLQLDEPNAGTVELEQKDGQQTEACNQQGLLKGPKTP